MSAAWRSRVITILSILPLLLTVAGKPGKHEGHGKHGKAEKSSGKHSKKSHSNQFRFEEPRGTLAEVGPVEFELRVPAQARTEDLTVEVDGTPVPFERSGRHVEGVFSGLGEGRHEVEARVRVPGHGDSGKELRTTTWFELVTLDRPDVCEILNQEECLFPFPSSRYLEKADTETGWRVALPQEAMPLVSVRTPLNFFLGIRFPLDPTPLNQHDGFSPTVQILMHFPGGVDLAASDAAILRPATRTFDLRSLQKDSPTLLIDAETGERVLHFVENDGQATGQFLPGQATVLRPAQSLEPGHRYIVAVRDLVHPDGSPVEAEPVFAALRDGRPSTIPALKARRKSFEDIFRRLERARVKRDDLVLAFDFVVQSDEQLTGEMLSMRDQGFEWLRDHDGGRFTVDSVEVVNPSCATGGNSTWKLVEGTFEVPLFLDSDNYADPDTLGFLQVNDRGRPFFTTTAHAPYGIAIPCRALDGPLSPLVFGHGLFGTGPGTLEDIAESNAVDLPYVAGGTNWSGLSSLELPFLPGSIDEVPAFLEQTFIGQVFLDFDDFPAMADRLRQGQLSTLILARMLARGEFNSHPEFRTPSGEDTIDAGETFYFGVSLGGIMGLMFSALTPDLDNLYIDVGAINFSFLLQRAGPFVAFETFLEQVEDDPNVALITLGLLGETWVRGEPAGYATHITRDPLPRTNRKKILMGVALYDQQVHNLGSQIAGATLGLRNVEGSALQDLPGIPDVRGPRRSGYVVYDTGSFDPQNPAHTPFIPPLTNDQAQLNRCDPHARQLAIPASIEQMLGFLQPDGVVENFCNGLCDAGDPSEIPFGAVVPCDPLAP
jgi:hypothetical protein